MHDCSPTGRRRAESGRLVLCSAWWAEHGRARERRSAVLGVGPDRTRLRDGRRRSACRPPRGTAPASTRAGRGSRACTRSSTGAARTRSPDVTPFDRIVIIFNPNSTGDAPGLAEELRADLAGRLPAVPVELCPTRYAGHARDLARDVARTGRPLLVSVSGDGGYNEVVDGVMQAGDSEAVCAVRAAGNANDHRRTTRQRPPADAIVAGGGRRVDLLRLAIGSGGAAQNRYAHPSVGRI